MALRPRISLVASSTRTFHSPLALLAPNRASPVRTQLSCFSSTSSFRDSTTPAQKPGIPWDEFLLLRRRRRYVNLFASVGTAVGAVAATVPVAMSYELEDKIASATGLDPFIAFGLMITAVGGFGWLMGPFVGNAGFLLANRRIRADIASVSSYSAIELESLLIFHRERETFTITSRGSGRILLAAASATQSRITMGRRLAVWQTTDGG